MTSTASSVDCIFQWPVRGQFLRYRVLVTSEASSVDFKLQSPAPVLFSWFQVLISVRVTVKDLLNWFKVLMSSGTLNAYTVEYVHCQKSLEYRLEKVTGIFAPNDCPTLRSNRRFLFLGEWCKNCSSVLTQYSSVLPVPLVSWLQDCPSPHTFKQYTTVTTEKWSCVQQFFSFTNSV